MAARSFTMSRTLTVEVAPSYVGVYKSGSDVTISADVGQKGVRLKLNVEQAKSLLKRLASDLGVSLQTETT